MNEIKDSALFNTVGGGGDVRYERKNGKKSRATASLSSVEKWWAHASCSVPFYLTIWAVSSQIKRTVATCANFRRCL